MDNSGINLLKDSVSKVDTLMFYQTRLEKYRAEGFPEEYLRRTFESDLRWYRNISDFMKSKKTAFGWGNSG